MSKGRSHALILTSGREGKVSICTGAYRNYRNWFHCQGRSQPHSPGWAIVPLSSFFSYNFDQFLYIFSQTLLIFFLILALRVGESSTWESLGYATVHCDSRTDFNCDIRGFCFSFCFVFQFWHFLSLQNIFHIFTFLKGGLPTKKILSPPSDNKW